MGVDLLNENETRFYKIYSKFSFIVGVLSCCLFESIVTFENARNPEKFIEMLMFYLIRVLGLLRVIVLYYNRKEVGALIKRLHEGLFKPDFNRGGKFEEEELKDVIKKTNIQSSFQILAYISAVLAPTIEAVVNLITVPKKERVMAYMLPMPSFINIHKFPNFELAFLYQYYALNISGLFIVMTDLLIAGVTAHISSQLRILQNAFRRIKERSVKNGNRSLPLVLTESIMHHQQLINVRNQVEDLFNLINLISLLGSTGVLCFCFYRVSQQQPMTPQFFQTLSIVAFTVIELLMYCWWGDQVTVESQNVAKAAAESEWVGENIGVQKSLILVMVRAQKPLRLTGGKVIFLSLETFMSVLRGSVSYFMILRQVRRRN